MEVYVAPINLEQYLQLSLLPVNHSSRCNEITTCKSCQLHGDFIHQPPFSFNTWRLDVTGIIKPKYSQLYQYTLATMNYFSKWAEGMPSKSIKAEDVANFMRTHNLSLSCSFQNNFGQCSVFQMHIHDQALQKVQHPTCIFCELQSIIQCPGRIIIFFKDIHTASKPRCKCNGQQKLEGLGEKCTTVQQSTKFTKLKWQGFRQECQI